MLLSHQSIPFGSINFSTDWNLHPWEFRAIPTELQENLSLNGIIHPPIVIADSAKTYAIVSGARRLEFAQKYTSFQRINCLVIDKYAPPAAVLNLILTDQSCAGSLSLAEKARFVEISSRILAPKDIVTTFMARLQIKNGRSTISNLLKIMQQDERIIREIHAGRIQDRMVTEILSLPEEADRLAIIQLFTNLGMGDGKQKRFFNLIRDMAFREKLSVTSFLQKDTITEILKHKEMNVPQKIQHLGNLLQHQITPTYSLAEEAFVKEVKSIHLPANHTITHSPYFEKDQITLSITFKNFADCAQYLKRHQERIAQ